MTKEEKDKKEKESKPDRFPKPEDWIDPSKHPSDLSDKTVTTNTPEYDQDV